MATAALWKLLALQVMQLPPPHCFGGPSLQMNGLLGLLIFARIIALVDQVVSTCLVDISKPISFRAAALVKGLVQRFTAWCQCEGTAKLTVWCLMSRHIEADHAVCLHHDHAGMGNAGLPNSLPEGW